MSGMKDYDGFRAFEPQIWGQAKVPGPLTGQQLGSYAFQEMVGVGTFSSVYRASHTFLRTDRAIKVLRTDLNTNQDVVSQFGYEARVMASLDHPNIVKIQDAGFNSPELAQNAGYYYTVMEYIDGKTLNEVFDSNHRPSTRKALHIVAGISRALEYAHSKGVIHNDLKPANVLIGKDSEVKLADFGSALKHDWTPLNRQRLAASSIYAAPEVRAGKEPTTESDIYSLGIMSFELITGQLPSSNLEGNTRLLDENLFGSGVHADSFLAQLDKPALRRFTFVTDGQVNRSLISETGLWVSGEAKNLCSILEGGTEGYLTKGLASVILEKALNLVERGEVKGSDQEAIQLRIEALLNRSGLLSVSHLDWALRTIMKNYQDKNKLAQAIKLLGLNKNSRFIGRSSEELHSLFPEE